MEVINHFLHTHPLMLIEKPEVNDTVYCSGCNHDISGSFYGCYICMYYLHKSCAELPREIQNFFHPCPLFLTVVDSYYTCNACFKRGSGFTYRCEGCDFDMHFECAQRPPLVSQGDDEELIHHFTHWHPLKLVVDPNQHSDFGCRICDKLCSESDSTAYCCEECNFFIHKSCMLSIPQKINHLFHPSCPLVLFTCHSNWCEPFDNSSWYDFHLREFSQNSNWCECSHDSYLCDASDNSCWYDFYCREFKPDSYACEGCDEDILLSGLAFCCIKCEFVLDVKCGLLPTVESEDSDKIQHSAHKHPLILRLGKEFGGEVRCRACGENFLLDPCFGCSTRSCDFFLHRTCAVQLPQKVHHPFHPRHPLILLSDLPYRCKGCDDSHEGSDLVYCCKECKFQLDVKCALFSTIESIEAEKILHCAHKHPLALHETEELGNEVRCRACAKSCLAPSFGCTECNFFLHRSCAVELHPKEKEIHHPFHPLHPLTLSSTPPLLDRDTFQCSSCLGSDDWNLLRYRCDKCDFDLHIDCVKPKLSPIFKYEGHKHHLTYYDKTLSPTQCNICHEQVQTGFFRCVACSYNMHIYCIPSTPRTIEHNHHSHPLTVTKSPFEYELISSEYADGSDDEFYCDLCEEKRYKFESVYYCAECKFIAEVCCVLSKLLPSLNVSTEHSAINGGVISRDEETEIKANIEKVKIEITELREEEKPLTVEIEKLRSTLKPLEEKLELMTLRLKELQVDHFLYNHLLSRNIKENEYPTEASTS